MPEDTILPEEQEEVAAVDENYTRLFDFNLARARLKRLVDEFNANVVPRVENNRSLRKLDIDPSKLRQSNKIKKDETMIGIRTINTNVEREQPAFISFLRNSRRQAVFTCVSDPNQKTDLIEEHYTKGMTYADWETPWYKQLDGTQVHGWDSIEVVFDPSKPLHVGIEHIGHDKLIFPLGALNIQSCEIIIRSYSVSQIELKRFVAEFGFDSVQVEDLLSNRSDERKDQNITIYKKFCKYGGQVWVAWFALEEATRDWLKQPAPLYLGIDEEVEEAFIDPLTRQEMSAPALKPAPIADFPVFLLRYRLTEEQEIKESIGRAFLDLPKQEALTALWSSYVNGATRASNIYGSPKGTSASGAGPKQLELAIEHGKFYSEPVEFWNTPYPDESLLRAAQALDVHNSQEVGQLTFAVQNKKGSRTTAKEISSAEEQNSLMNSVQLTLFSTHIRQVHSFIWPIVQSRAIRGEIQFLNTIENVVIDPVSGQEIISRSNDVEAIAKVYDIRAAGDVDVIQRAEKLEKMREFLPSIQAIGGQLFAMFFTDMLKIAFPDDGEKYGNLLAMGMEDKQLIQQLSQMLMSSLTEEDLAGMGLREKQALQGLQQQVAMSLNLSPGN